MTAVEGIIGLCASVVAILTGVGLGLRWFIKRLEKRLDRWVNTIVDNSEAMKNLTERLASLEGAFSVIKGKLSNE